MPKPKIALFDLTGCEGCEFHLLSLNEGLHDLFQDFEISHWRLLTENKKEDFDIAIIEGAVTTKTHIALLKQIRKTAKTVIAIGACALTGNFFSGLDPEKRKSIAKKVYGNRYQLKADFLEPVDKYIHVDVKIPGCPPDLEAFKTFLGKIKSLSEPSLVLEVAPPDYVAKIEGHGSLKIDFRQRRAVFEIEESERLVEGLLLGKPFSQAPFINARICGICPVAHSLCSWQAIENALGIESTAQVITLREIMLASQIVKSHLLHLFFLVLPDFAGLKGSLELSAKYPAEFHLMLNIKRVSEKALTFIAGSSAFPTNLGLGGFLKPPEIGKLLSVRDEINDITDEARDLISLFADFPVAIIESSVKTLTTSSPPDRYPLYQSIGVPRVIEEVQSDSTAKLGRVGDQIVKVGALARLSGFTDRLRPMAKEVLKNCPFEIKNPYNNNLAQAVEILHYLEEVRVLIESLIGQNLAESKAIKAKPSGKNKGRACLEAPRGILVHEVRLDQEGRIIDYNIVPPTQINLASLEAEAQLVLQERGQSDRETRREIEKLIRAFDPCITCAVH